MSWVRTTQAAGGVSTPEQPWSPEEATTLAAAVNRAPSVHNTQPWSLELRGRTAILHDRPDRALIQHDPYGRDQQISCGAALTNLVLAVYSLGWSADVYLSHGDRTVATVVASRRRRPTASESQRYRAIVRRASYRRAFERQPLSHVTKEALRQATRSSGVFARWLTGPNESAYLGRSLAYAARVRQDDPSYQWELAAWTAEPDRTEGIPAAAFGVDAMSATGLATTTTRLPDEHRLARRIDSESVLVLSTTTEGREGNLQVGQAMEQAWLAATSLGIAASVMTQPLQLTEIRTGLAERLMLVGTPQILMRFGYPAIPVPRSARRPLGEIFVEEEHG